jgi:ketosteroid isomerase-like protein
MPNTQEIAAAFTALLKDGKHEEAAATYNAADIRSVEAMGGDFSDIRGTAAVKAKGDWWYANHDIHAFSAHGPYVNGDQFMVRFSIDVTAKASGQRVQMDEVGLYTVNGGKIVEERFFY